MTLNDQALLLFFNPTAGRGRASRHAASISQLLDARGISHTLVASEYPGDIEARVLESIHQGCRRLLVAGGDGSVHEAVNGILRSATRVEFGVIPIGTGNDFAKASNIPLHWEDAATLLADRLANTAPGRPIDAGRCNERYFANSLGIGFDAKVSRIAQSIQWPIGDLVYLLAVFRGIWDGIATPQISLRWDGGSFNGPLTLASICNGPWVGGMFHMAPMARNDDGAFELVYAEAVTRTRIMRLLPKILQGRHIDEAEVSWNPLTRCKVIAAAPVPSHLDGEIQPLQTTFDIELLGGALSLL
jgi:YegS/Rv2252/BmrU family lipid kinase